MSLAIGKRGQNVRLASKLTEWRIDIRSETELEETFKKTVAEFMEKLEIGEVLARMLYNEGFASIEEIANGELEELLEIEGLEEEKARWIHERAQAAAAREEAGENVSNALKGTALEEVPGVGPKLMAELRQFGIETVEDLASMPVEKLMEVPGVGEKTAQKLLNAAQSLLEGDDDAS